MQGEEIIRRGADTGDVRSAGEFDDPSSSFDDRTV